MTILDYGTLVSYFALNLDILLQIRRIHHTKSSHDLSMVGMTIRFVALVVILAKFMSLGDTPLIIGQAVGVLTFSTYFLFALTYFQHRKKKKR